MRDLVISCSNIDCQPLLADWRWLVPVEDTPLFLGAFGDWIFGAPDGSLWSLELLEGTYSRVALNAAEYDLAKTDANNLNLWFMAEWVEIAERHGIVPGLDECLGWRLHPMLGGSFSVANIQVFSLAVYQSVMGQLFRQMRRQG